MMPTTYSRIRKELTDSGAFRANNAHGLLTAGFEFAFFTAGIALLASLRPWSVGFLLVQAALATSAYRMFVLLHESGHGSLFRSRWLNDLVGTLAGFGCLIPYHPWKHIHQAHHQWVGVIDKDPTQAHLLKLRTLPWHQKILFKVFWKSWLPVPFVKFVFDLFWGQPFRELLAGQRRKAILGFVSLAACVGPHATMMWWFGPLRYAAMIGPMLLMFYVLFEMVNLPQHSGYFPFLSRTHPRPIPFREQDEITRTTYLPKWLGVVLCYNFNLHTEHHLFPTVPWYRLPHVRSKIKDQPDCHYEEVGFIEFMAKLRMGNPMDLYEKTLPKEDQP